MKIVLKLSSFLIKSREHLRKFACAAVSLQEDGHCVVVIHGEPSACINSATEAMQLEKDRPASDHDFLEISKANRRLVSSLCTAGAAALGISGADAAMCRVRKNQLCNARYSVRVVDINPFWLDLISTKGGMPVISSVVVEPSGEDCLVDSDEFGAACARTWMADALIFITSADGVIDLNGTPIRWLDLELIELLKKESLLREGMLVKVNACKQALERGVRRVRILPAAQVETLSSFFFTRIDHGTEVIAIRNRASSAISSASTPDLPSDVVVQGRRPVRSAT
jgi:acetylglutamate kinase